MKEELIEKIIAGINDNTLSLREILSYLDDDTLAIYADVELPVTDEQKQSQISFQDLFVQWVTINHDNHQDCDVATALKADQNSEEFMDNLIKAVQETEGGAWIESWEQFLNDHIKSL